MLRVFFILTILVLASCSPEAPQPVDISESESCSLCSMTISRKQYAAELIDGKGQVYKYDDIGCLIEHARKHGLDKQGDGKIHMFFQDYDSGGWLRSGQAQFVRSTQLQTPMASGLIAVADRNKAESYAKTNGGEALTFEEIWK